MALGRVPGGRGDSPRRPRSEWNNATGWRICAGRSANSRRRSRAPPTERRMRPAAACAPRSRRKTPRARRGGARNPRWRMPARPRQRRRRHSPGSGRTAGRRKRRGPGWRSSSTRPTPRWLWPLRNWTVFPIPRSRTKRSNGREELWTKTRETRYPESIGSISGRSRMANSGREGGRRSIPSSSPGAGARLPPNATWRASRRASTMRRRSARRSWNGRSRSTANGMRSPPKSRRPICVASESAGTLSDAETRLEDAARAMRAADSRLAERREERVRREAEIDRHRQLLDAVSERVRERLGCSPEAILETAGIEPEFGHARRGQRSKRGSKS